jgi:hypothetical protein
MLQRPVQKRVLICVGFFLCLLASGMSGISFLEYNTSSPNLDSQKPQVSTPFDGYIHLNWNRTLPDDRVGGAFWMEPDNFYTITSEYPGVWNYVILSKWNEFGNIIWEKQWNGLSPSDYISDIWGDNDYLYGCGRSYGQRFPMDIETSTFLIVKWDKQGNEIYNLTWNTGFEDIFHRIWGDEEFMYVLGTSTNTTYTGSSEQPYINNVTLLKIDFNGNLIWNRTWEWYYFHYSGNPYPFQLGIDLWGDEQNLYCLHQENTTIHTYDKNGNLVWNISYPETDSLAITGDSSNLFITTYSYDNSSIIKIDKLGHSIFQKHLNRFHFPVDICINNGFLYITGFTYRDFDISGIDLTKFDTNGNLIGNNSWFPVYIPYYDLSGYLIISVGENLYVVGGSYNLYYILKWDLIPPYFLYFGVPPIGIAAIGTILWIWIKPIKRHKRKILVMKLESIEDKLINSEYQGGLSKLDESLPLLEEFRDPELLKKWEVLHKKCNVDMFFLDRLDDQKRNIENNEIETAYEALIKLLREANSSEYVDFVDKRIVSGITETLKSISDQV